MENSKRRDDMRYFEPLSKQVRKINTATSLAHHVRKVAALTNEVKRRVRRGR
jgi:hypothetical protein